MMSFCSLVSSRCRLRPMRLVKAASVSLVILIVFNLMISDIGDPRSPGPGDTVINGLESGESKSPTTLSPDVSFLLNSYRPSSKPVPPLARSGREANVSDSRGKISSKNAEHVVKERHPVEAPIKSSSGSVILPDHPPRPRLMAEPPSGDLNATRRYREALRKNQLDINVEQFVHNSRKFGLNPFTSNPHLIVVVVQVHNRSQYLQHLVESFRKAANVNNMLLIFSHDFYSEKLNEIVDKVDFCPVLQIYYPYTIQAFPDQFPGKDPKDCPRDIGVARAKELKCNNYKHPDKFGHYREAKYTATKHHWWWKIHRIFDELDILTDYNGPVLILEEDHYVAPDFLPVLKLMLALKRKECDTCSLLALGNYDKKPSYKNGLAEKVSIESWVSSKHNMGMVIDRKSYDALKRCRKEFCNFDDYNWDWSLQFISASCLKLPLQTMVIKSPRVFHIGECGLHHKGKNCTTEARLNQISKILQDNKQFLFPKRLSVLSRRVVMKPKPPKPNGGWGDIRDHELCFSYVSDQNQA